MSTNSRGTPFWTKPTGDLSPGDIFSEVPIHFCVPPLSVVQRYNQNLPPKYAQNLYQVFKEPLDAKLSQSVVNKGGADVVCRARLTDAIFLTWGSDVEADERFLQQQGKVGGRVWAVAPVYPLTDIPGDKTKKDEKTGEPLSQRDIIRRGWCTYAFYLPPYPDEAAEHEGRYVDFRKICPLGVEYFIQRKASRKATLQVPDSLNDFYHHLLWHFTRAEIFFRPVKCPACGKEVPVDTRVQGQNIEAVPWERPEEPIPEK